jgi:hypothetical protein
VWLTRMVSPDMTRTPSDAEPGVLKASKRLCPAKHQSRGRTVTRGRAGTPPTRESAARRSRAWSLPKLIMRLRRRCLRTLTEELDRAAELILRWLAETDAPKTIAVLVREQRQRDRLVSGLAERGVTLRAVDREHIKPGAPVAMIMHRAKGTEFSKVLLFGVDQGDPPAAAGRAVCRGRLG